MTREIVIGILKSHMEHDPLDAPTYHALGCAITELETTCKTENDEEKPPKGIEPYWVVIPERIDNLAETIKRYSGRKDGKVETWAAEIVALRKVQELLDKEYGR